MEPVLSLSWKGDEGVENRPFSDISYRQFLSEEKLMGSRCRKCGKLFLPPRPICTECSSGDMEWKEVKGKGKLCAFTVISVGPPFMVEEGYSREHPYCVGVVELEEGPRIVARIEGFDNTRPENIKVGTPLTVDFIHREIGGERKTYLAFRP